MLSSTRWEKYSRERSLESLHPHGRRYLIEWSNRMSETTYCTYNFQRLINLVVRDTKVIDLQDRSKRRTETKIEVFLLREYEKISLRMNSRWTESIIENSARILSVRFLAIRTRGPIHFHQDEKSRRHLLLVCSPFFLHSRFTRLEHGDISKDRWKTRVGFFVIKTRLILLRYLNLIKLLLLFFFYKSEKKWFSRKFRRIFGGDSRIYKLDPKRALF